MWLIPAVPAGAGGSWMHPTWESYEPGDEVTAVGYTQSSVPEKEGRYLARLQPVPMTPEHESSRSQLVPLGPVTIEESGLGGYLSTRVSITFELPMEMVPGAYYIEVTDDEGSYFGDLIGMGLSVGVQPSHPQWVEWPLDEPLIAELSDDAVISGPGFAVPVSDLRLGLYPPGAEEFMLDPARLTIPRPPLLPDDSASPPERQPGAIDIEHHTPQPRRPDRPQLTFQPPADSNHLEWTLGTLAVVTGLLAVLRLLPGGRPPEPPPRTRDELEERVLVSP